MAVGDTSIFADVTSISFEISLFFYSMRFEEWKKSSPKQQVKMAHRQVIEDDQSFIWITSWASNNVLEFTM